jgi:hypothetical protein
MSKFTPGPWYWNDQDQMVSEVLEDIDYFGPTQIVIIETDSGVYPPRGQDRRLIAAAPELLAALQDFALYFRSRHFDCIEQSNAYVLAIAAIAKATGEQA